MHGVFYENCGIYAKNSSKIGGFSAKNPKIHRLPKTVITQDIEQMLPLIHNMLTTCANC